MRTACARRTGAAPLRRAAAPGAILLCLASLSFAGPIVTFDLKDGRKIEADVQWFSEGRFAVRELQTDDTIKLDASAIKAIDFGETYRESGPPRPLNLAAIRTQAEQRRFRSLLQTFINLTAARLKELDGAIGQELERPALSADDRRDLSLARVLSLWAMGQEENAKALFAKIRADHPDDPSVKRFDLQMHNLKGWAVEPTPPPPEKGP